MLYEGISILEIESFAQCLNYIATTDKGKSSIELLIPVISTLSGVIIGFGMNVIRDKSKTKKENANKVMCIEEDADRIRRASGHVFTEAIRLIDLVRTGTLPKSHGMPGEINSPYLDKHFIEIAHLFSLDQRHNIAALFPSLKDINADLKSLSTPSISSDLASLRRCCFNIASLAVFCIERCDVFLDGAPEYRYDWIYIAKRLNIQSNIINELIIKQTPTPQETT